MTHVLDTSAALANILGEPGMERVRALLKDEGNVVAVSVLTLYEVYTTILHRTGSDANATEVVAALREAIGAVIPVTEETLTVAFELRRASTSRLAIADLLIAATAAQRGAVLVHRDPHFAALPAGRPAQEALPDKA